MLVTEGSGSVDIAPPAGGPPAGDALPGGGGGGGGGGAICPYAARTGNSHAIRMMYAQKRFIVLHPIGM